MDGVLAQKAWVLYLHGGVLAFVRDMLVRVARASVGGVLPWITWFTW